MKVNIFGKQNCGNCKSTKKMLAFFIPKWGLGEKIQVEFHDMETTDGFAEGAFHDVADKLPTVIVANGDKTLARWDGKIPNTEELKVVLTANA